METPNALKVEKYVAATVFLHAIAYLLTCVNKACHNKYLKHVSWICYFLVPVLVTYTLGLMGESEKIKEFPVFYLIWGFILLIAYTSSDNLNCFRLDETNNRLNLFFQYYAKIIMLLFFFKYFPFLNKFPFIRDFTINYPKICAIVLLFVLLQLKLTVRLASMAHASGATSFIRGQTMIIVGHMNGEMDDDEVEVDPVSMKGIKYSVGTKLFPLLWNTKIEDVITVEQIWGCNKYIFGPGDPDGQLKDTCLSFALFLLILGRFWGHSLYEGMQSKTNAWKLVYDGLVGQGSSHERVFRIIEVELSFLQDFFHSNYLPYYALGLVIRVMPFLLLAIVSWWCTIKGLDYKDPSLIDPIKQGVYTKTLLLVMFALELMQFIMFLFSRWVKVFLLCRYAGIEISKKAPCLCALKAASALCRASLFFNNIVFKPWKRELDQYSLCESCTSNCGLRKVEGACLTCFGIPFVERGKKLNSSVVLCEDVKRAVIQSLCIDSSSPKFSNGVASLRRNGVEDLLSWSCKPRKYAETILLWHVATEFCGMNPNSQLDGSQVNFKVATRLSRYCAYLLVYAPLLLPVPALQAEFMCDAVIREARKLFKEPRDDEGLSKYNKLKEYYWLSIDEEENRGERTATLLRKGVKLGEELESAVEDEGRRWKILAEFWAEMILFLAPSSSNEKVHADKLADGGEFITHLWALLIHAGVVYRDDMEII